MSKILIAVVGFALGGAFVIGPALALESGQSSTRQVVMSPAMMSGVAVSQPSQLAVTRLAILHVQRGCHVWSDGKMQTASMRLRVAQGSRLSVVDQDIDPHQLIEVSGPQRLAVGPHMMMNGRSAVTFRAPGIYRFATKTVEMPGAMMPTVKTVGPDNDLKLTVTVQ